MTNQQELDRGPFFHGTKASLQLGDLLVPRLQTTKKDVSPTTFILRPL